MSTRSLFAPENDPRWIERLGTGTFLLHGFALPSETALLQDIQQVTSCAPFRHMRTPGGFEMSVAMSNCGLLGWTSDPQGYRYSPCDPITGNLWPEMPASFIALAASAAAAAGFPAFMPDACLINRYQPSARLSLHQDKDEKDFAQPIVSVSLGVTATFLLGGLKRTDKTARLPLIHGDVVVWGGSDRLRYHGILALKNDHHPAFGAHRINLTFRKAA